MRSTVLLAGALGFLLGSARRPSPPPSMATVLRRVATAVLASITGVVLIAVIGEVLAAPGGWEGLGLAAAIVVPVTTGALLAWLRPSVAAPVLGLATVAYLVAAIVVAFTGDWFQEVEERNGPVQMVVLFTVVLPLAVLGYRRPGAAGALLVPLALVPLAVELLAGLAGATPLVLVAAPLLGAATMYLLSAREDARQGR